LLGVVTAGALVLAAPGVPAQERMDLDLGGGVSLPVVRVPAGTFTMGSPPGETGRKDDETAHEVTLTQDFYIGDAPVTRGQFARFVAETGYRTEAEAGTSGGHGWNGTKLAQSPRYTWKDPGFPQTDDHPVVLVTYEDALAFTRWLSGKSGRDVTLPTEAQWEYAARGGSSSPWFAAASSENARELGWSREAAGNGTRAVKQRPANGFGLHDVAGNVWEWCLDWYGPYPPGAATDPMIASPPAGETPRRVLRGGSWLTGVDKARSAARYRNTPGSRNADNGFRVVASVADARAAGAPQDSPRPSSLEGGAASTGSSDLGQGSTSTGSNTADSDDSGKGAFLMLGVLGATGVILLARRAGRRRQQAALGHLSVRPAADGFRIDTPLSPGTRVGWSARLRDGLQTGEVEATGGPLFVYTGQRPRAVKAFVLGSGVQGASTSGGPGFPGQPATPSRTKDPWSQQPQDAQATMTAVAYQTTYESSHHGISASSSGSSSEPFSGWPSAY
jgi:formylglycine-generating enzyme required for sulfatase activity